MNHRFVEFIPEVLEDDVIYVALEFGTVLHKCACGCGSQVATPLAPKGWFLTYDGETISLHPSVGNWNLPCRSHYWIRNNQAVWAPSWTETVGSDSEPADRANREDDDDAMVPRPAASTSQGLGTRAVGWVARFLGRK